MAPQEPAEIKAHIKAQGDSLKENFDEIQNRVKEALDWKIWYRNNTGLALSGAVAGGFLLSVLLRRDPSTESEFMDSDEMDIDDEGSLSPSSRRMRPESKSPSRLRQVADNTVSAVLGLAADKFQDYMSKAVPGFREHYADAQRKRFG